MLTPLFEVTPRPEERLISLTYGDAKQKSIMAYMVAEVSSDGRSIAKVGKRNVGKGIDAVPLGTTPNGDIIWMLRKNGSVTIVKNAVGA